MAHRLSDQLLTPLPRLANGGRYVIACDRCAGGEWLSVGLSETSLAGEPAEFFADELHALLKLQLEVNSDLQYIPKLISFKTTPNNLFGMTVSWSHMDRLAACVLATAGMPQRTPIARIFTQLLDSAMGCPIKYVWLRRRNKVAQAVSLLREQHAGVQMLPLETVLRSRTNPTQERLNFEAIDSLVLRVTRHESNWGCYFRNYGIQPLVLFYEDLVHNYDKCVLEVLRYLNLPEVSITTRPSMEPSLNDADLLRERRYQDLTASGGEVRGNIFR